LQRTELRPLYRAINVLEPNANGAVPGRESDEDARLRAGTQYHMGCHIAFTHEAVEIESFTDVESQSDIDRRPRTH